MLESGIGRAHNIHLSTLPNFTLPGDIAASRRYFAPDLIEPEIEVSRDGTIAVPTGPGIGVTVDWDRVAAATVETAGPASRDCARAPRLGTRSRVTKITKTRGLGRVAFVQAVAVS